MKLFNPKIIHEDSSFRDPSGFIFYYNEEIFRAVSKTYSENYDLLMNSGLYTRLINEGLLIKHKEVEFDNTLVKDSYKILKPELIDFISYPYEWCFSQYKDAALTVLKIQRIALEYDLSLKDSSVYNIQFHHGTPILIDTLSFQKYEEGKPWIAYRQFCQHFLVPLSLMSKVDIRLSQLMRVYIDGIPIDFADSILPFFIGINLFIHIRLHSRSKRDYSNTKISNIIKTKKYNKKIFLGLIDSLESSITVLKWYKKDKDWDEYYSGTHHIDNYYENKKMIIEDYLETVKPKRVWDIGANTGLFSRLCSNKGIPTVAFDSDFLCVEKNYNNVKSENEKKLLPIYMDLINPSSGIGWEHKERKSLHERGPVDLIMALAIIHHLAISNNLPLVKFFEFMQDLCNWLIIEFIPKTDPMVIELLKYRTDIFIDYSNEKFESSLSEYFEIVKINKIQKTQRVLYLLRNKKC